jgi:dCTP deaminase
MNLDAPLLFPELLPRSASPRTTGLLPSQRLLELIETGHIRAGSCGPIEMNQIQPSSLDLRFGPVAYRVEASFLPNSSMTVARKLADLKAEAIDLSAPTTFGRREIYIVPLQEELTLPENYWAKANPKSSTGRLDVFIRLITDYGSSFEETGEGYRGKLYAEVIPLTFPIIVRIGARLNQLRIRRGSPLLYDKYLVALHGQQPIVYSPEALPVEPIISDGLKLSVDLVGVRGSEIVGYKARRDTPPIDLANVNHYEVSAFWEPIYRTDSRSIVLEPGEFYILTSKEKVTVAPHLAAEMLPFDPAVGEFRIHYAGFFDPGFGWSADRSTGSHAVLEVRAHEVRSHLEHGQIVGRLNYEYLIARPDKLYGGPIGSSYQAQGLTLSKHFKRDV